MICGLSSGSLRGCWTTGVKCPQRGCVFASHQGPNDVWNVLIKSYHFISLTMRVSQQARASYRPRGAQDLYWIRSHCLASWSARAQCWLFYTFKWSDKSVCADLALFIITLLCCLNSSGFIQLRAPLALKLYKINSIKTLFTLSLVCLFGYRCTFVQLFLKVWTFPWQCHFHYISNYLLCKALQNLVKMTVIQI